MLRGSVIQTDVFQTEGMGKYIYESRNQKRERIIMLTSDKSDFNSITTIRDKEGDYIMIEGLFNQEVCQL